MRRCFPATPALLLSAALALPACAGGQEQPEKAAVQPASPVEPVTWQTRADQGHEAAEGFTITGATPGWRVSTGKFSGILYRPGQQATGSYEVIATVHLLAGSRRGEGYGVFLGGSALDGDGQRYTYFLLRDDGKYLVKVRDGGSTTTVVDWTTSAAIRTLPASAGADTATNTLVVQVTPNAVTLLINGERILRRPRGELPLDGVIGIRANHGLELQVQSLDVGEPAAPAE